MGKVLKPEYYKTFVKFYKTVETLIDQNFVWFKQRQMSLDKLRFRKSHRRFSIECRAIALVLILVLILIRFEIG